MRTSQGSWGSEASPSFGQNLYFEHKYKIFRPLVSFSFEKSVFFGRNLDRSTLIFLNCFRSKDRVKMGEGLQLPRKCLGKIRGR